MAPYLQAFENYANWERAFVLAYEEGRQPF